jgi:hypothetical protein
VIITAVETVLQEQILLGISVYSEEDNEDEINLKIDSIKYNFTITNLNKLSVIYITRK